MNLYQSIFLPAKLPFFGSTLVIPASYSNVASPEIKQKAKQTDIYYLLTIDFKLLVLELSLPHSHPSP